MTLVAGTADSLGPVWTSDTMHGLKFRTFNATTTPLSAAWPAANDAYLVPFYMAVPQQIVALFFQAGTTPGTTAFDLGIYRDDFTRIVSLGATAAVSTTDAILPVGGGAIASTTLTRGRYYMAMSAAAITLTARAAVQANHFMRAVGMKKMAAAHPLPATITPASMGTTAFMPMVGMSTLTNIL